MATGTTILTAAEYARLPDTGTLTELVRGKVIELNQPTPRHGWVCSKVDRTETARLYYPDAPEVILSGDDELTFPDQLPGFSVPVRRFFE